MHRVTSMHILCGEQKVVEVQILFSHLCLDGWWREYKDRVTAESQCGKVPAAVAQFTSHESLTAVTTQYQKCRRTLTYNILWMCRIYSSTIYDRN